MAIYYRILESGYFVHRKLDIPILPIAPHALDDTPVPIDREQFCILVADGGTFLLYRDRLIVGPTEASAQPAGPCVRPSLGVGGLLSATSRDFYRALRWYDDACSETFDESAALCACVLQDLSTWLVAHIESAPCS